MAQGLPERGRACSQVSAALPLLPGVLGALFSSPGITQEPAAGLGPAPSAFPGDDDTHNAFPGTTPQSTSPGRCFTFCLPFH